MQCTEPQKMYLGTIFTQILKTKGSSKKKEMKTFFSCFIKAQIVGRPSLERNLKWHVFIPSISYTLTDKLINAKGFSGYLESCTSTILIL